MPYSVFWFRYNIVQFRIPFHGKNNPGCRQKEEYVLVEDYRREYLAEISGYE